LQEDLTELGFQKAIPDLRRIQAAGKRLLEMINSILDLSRIEAGKMDLFLENFDLAEMINEVQETSQALAAKNDNRLSVSVQPNVGIMYADVTKVRQILFNLLSNAGKFTEKGKITLSVERQTSDGADCIDFKVSDTGIGILPEQMELLFKEFTQADPSATRKYGGTGLGLAISKRFCQMMGGDIRAESKP